jgi:hypothetical protein
MKSAIGALGVITDFELFLPKVQRLKSEIVELARFSKVFERPERSLLEVASRALQGL